MQTCVYVIPVDPISTLTRQPSRPAPESPALLLKGLTHVTVCPRMVWGYTESFRRFQEEYGRLSGISVCNAGKFQEFGRFTGITQTLPTEDRPNPEYSRDVGDSTRSCPSDLDGGSLSSGTRQHARIGRFRSSAQLRTQKACCSPRGKDPPPQLRHRPPRCPEPLPGAASPIFGCRGGLGRLDFGNP